MTDRCAIDKLDLCRDLLLLNPTYGATVSFEELSKEKQELYHAYGVAISALKERMERADGWIDVRDRPPERFEDCLCYVLVPENGGIARHDYEVLHMKNDNRTEWNCNGMIVTHWQPLPEPPSTDKKGGNEQ